MHLLLCCLCSIAHDLTPGSESYDVSVLAGCGRAGNENGRADECTFRFPSGMAVDEATHSCFVVDSGNNSIRRIVFAD